MRNCSNVLSQAEALKMFDVRRNCFFKKLIISLTNLSVLCIMPFYYFSVWETCLLFRTENQTEKELIIWLRRMLVLNLRGSLAGMKVWVSRQNSQQQGLELKVSIFLVFLMLFRSPLDKQINIHTLNDSMLIIV